MSVPSAAAHEVAILIEQWIGGFRHPILVNLAKAMAPPTGTALGFEVLGFDSGRFHTWLCYGLIDNAAQELAVHPNELGLIATHADAVRLTELANRKRGTTDGTPEDVTWFPALITAYEPLAPRGDVGRCPQAGPTGDKRRPL
jgi:hypothetical protein